jgi:hypothetical protein
MSHLDSSAIRPCTTIPICKCTCHHHQHHNVTLVVDLIHMAWDIHPMACINHNMLYHHRTGAHKGWNQRRVRHREVRVNNWIIGDPSPLASFVVFYCLKSLFGAFGYGDGNSIPTLHVKGRILNVRIYQRCMESIPGIVGNIRLERWLYNKICISIENFPLDDFK